jgi:hypothetical protein
MASATALFGYWLDLSMSPAEVVCLRLIFGGRICGGYASQEVLAWWQQQQGGIVATSDEGGRPCTQACQRTMAFAQQFYIHSQFHILK